MAFDDIQQYIKDKAADEIKVIEKRSSDELAALEKEWKVRLGEEKERLLKDIERYTDSKLAQAKFKIREKVNAKLLGTKQAQLDSVYADALEEVAKLPKGEYEALLETLLSSIKDEEGELLTSKERHAELAAAAKKAGCKASISTDAIETVGGFVFQSKSIDRDFRFETIMERVREQSLIEVYQSMFNA